MSCYRRDMAGIGVYRAYLSGYITALAKGQASTPAADNEACAFALGMRDAHLEKDPRRKTNVEADVAELLK